MKKITVGYVVQSFEDGKCVSQEFVAGDEVTCVDENGNVVELSESDYYPFDMVQPT